MGGNKNIIKNNNNILAIFKDPHWGDMWSPVFVCLFSSFIFIWIESLLSKIKSELWKQRRMLRVWSRATGGGRWQLPLPMTTCFNSSSLKRTFYKWATAKRSTAGWLFSFPLVSSVVEFNLQQKKQTNKQLLIRPNHQWTELWVIFLEYGFIFLALSGQNETHQMSKKLKQTHGRFRGSASDPTQQHNNKPY